MFMGGVDKKLELKEGRSADRRLKELDLKEKKVWENQSMSQFIGRYDSISGDSESDGDGNDNEDIYSTSYLYTTNANS